MFLLTMFLYTAFSKYFDWASFKQAMENQHFTQVNTKVLIIVLPPVEIVTGTLLIFQRTRQIGFYISLLLMILFTGYVGLILLGYFSIEPCPCGGALKEMTWLQHFTFNLFFLAISFAGTLMQNSLNTNHWPIIGRIKIFHARNQVNAGPEDKTSE